MTTTLGATGALDPAFGAGGVVTSDGAAGGSGIGFHPPPAKTEASGCIEQKRRLERRLEREHIVLGSLPELSMRLLETCRERGRITVAEATRLTGANRNTIKDHLRRLTEAGHLARHGAKRGTWYELR